MNANLPNWDQNAKLRHIQIMSGKDLSYDYVLWKTTKSVLSKMKTGKLLDYGCGPGVISSRIAKLGWDVIGIDHSPQMIKIANQEFGDSKKLRFKLSGAEEVTNIFKRNEFDVVVSIMVIHGIDNLYKYFRSIQHILKSRGVLIVASLHPCFWRYARNVKEALNNYWETIKKYEEFTVSLDRNPLPNKIPVIYRPLEDISNALFSSNFVIERIIEPKPPQDIEDLYPESWPIPRIIFIVCKPHKS